MANVQQGGSVQIHQQRAERQNLQRIVAGGRFSDKLADLERAAILGLWRSARHLPANSAIDIDGGVRLITSGWAGWLRYAEDGRRLIFLFLMPGDFIIPQLFEPGCCDLVSLSPMRTVDAALLIGAAKASTPQSATMIANSGRYYRLLLIDHLTRLTSGCTTRSLANLLSEFHERSIRAGTSENGRFRLPIGQRVLGRALGRSTVQVNKVINQFQANGLIKVGYDWVDVLQPQQLQAIAGVTKNGGQAARFSAAMDA